ncbi:hypothetical protein GCM10027321_10660 [Massilia terrae]|uniref:Lipase chaperone n=1 Tax=Massilia terrae TaxID=1811224 RepID=A0ABT2D212_9BURK|nr:hypothetical protein [Massilia terrae]MCS0660299.1 hypothetical protein [Massilia terrae]
MRSTGLLDVVFDSKLALGIAGAAAVAVGVYGVVLWQRPAEAPADAPAKAGSWNDPVGPGLLRSASPAAPAFDMQVPRDANIAVDALGHLVPDLALRKLMDGFLVKSKPSDRQAMLAQLRQFVTGRLRQPAAGEADHLAIAYDAYLQEEARMVASERFSAPDPGGLSDQQVQHLLAWQHDRARLRERMLGATVAAAWFTEEDVNCTDALNEWEKQLAPPGDDDSAEQFNRRRWGDTLARRRNDNAQACAAQIARSIAPHG